MEERKQEMLDVGHVVSDIGSGTLNGCLGLTGWSHNHWSHAGCAAYRVTNAHHSHTHPLPFV